MSKVILVTGSSSGLGISVAVQAAIAGHTVYATMRDVGKRDALDAAAKDADVSLKILPLDVVDTTSIMAAVDRIITDEGRIDVLVANAGAGFARSTEQASEADAQWVMDVNFMGVLRCTKAVLPHMREARAGHVVAISSVGGLVGQPFHEIYCAAKFAVEGYIESLATYVTPAFGVNFTAVEPGGIATEFAASVMKQIEASGGLTDDAYLPVMQKFLGSRETPPEGIMQSAEEVARVLLDCISSDDPPIRTRTSDWSEDFTRLKTQADPDGKKLQKKVIDEMLGGVR